MLKKLIRHDGRSILNRLFPIYIAMLGTGVLQLPLGFALGALYSSTGFSMLYSVFMVVYALLWVALGVLTLYASFTALAQYYQSLYTDEAYFTLTLPMKAQTLFFGKLLSGLIWLTVTLLLGALSVAVGCLNYILADLTAFAEFFIGIPEFIDVWLLMDIPTLVVSYVTTAVRFYAAVTVGGCLLRQHKIIGIVVFYYLFSTISSVALGIVVLPSAVLLLSMPTLATVISIVLSVLVYAVESVVLSLISIRTLARRFDVD